MGFNIQSSLWIVFSHPDELEGSVLKLCIFCNMHMLEKILLNICKLLSHVTSESLTKSKDKCLM